MPKISVITASYNCENTIQETIESVISQTYKDWELIIVDDGSKDNSVNIIKKYCNEYDNIKLFTHADNKNKGLKHTLELGISKASSKWIHFCECDDILKENALAEKIKVIEKYPNVSIVFSEVELFGDKACIETYLNYRSRCVNQLLKETYPTNVIKKSPNDNLIPTFSCVMCKKSDLEKCDFNTPIDAYIDWYLWSQFADKQVYYVSRQLTKWRIHNNSYGQIFKEKNDLYYRKLYNLIIKQNIYKKNKLYCIFELLYLNIKFIMQKIFSVRNIYYNNEIFKSITILNFNIKIKKNYLKLQKIFEEREKN